MIKLWEFLLHGCWHKWKVINRIDLMDSAVSKDVPIGSRFVLQCEKCQRFKKIDVT